jgi:hypothetical protein
MAHCLSAEELAEVERAAPPHLLAAARATQQRR